MLSRKVFISYTIFLSLSGGELVAAQFYENVTEEVDDRPDGQFCKWFLTDDIFTNANTVVSRVDLNPTPSISSSSDGKFKKSDRLLRMMFGPCEILNKWMILVGLEFDKSLP